MYLARKEESSFPLKCLFSFFVLFEEVKNKACQCLRTLLENDEI